MHTYIPMCTHNVHTYTYIYIYKHIVYTCTQYIYFNIYIHLYILICTYSNTYRHICTNVCTHMHVSVNFNAEYIDYTCRDNDYPARSCNVYGI